MMMIMMGMGMMMMNKEMVIDNEISPLHLQCTDHGGEGDDEDDNETPDKCGKCTGVCVENAKRSSGMKTNQIQDI